MDNVDSEHLAFSLHLCAIKMEESTATYTNVKKCCLFYLFIFTVMHVKLHVICDIQNTIFQQLWQLCSSLAYNVLCFSKVMNIQ